MKTQYDADGDVIELGDDFFKNAKTIDHFPTLQAIVGKRGKQKSPTKTPVSLRLSPEVADYFKSTGKGWQTRLNEVLLDYVRNHQ